MNEIKSDNTRTILVVDDHSIVRHGLASLLAREKDFRIISEAGNYDEALEAMARQTPDVAIVDITLKDKSGLDLIRAAREKYPEIKYLVLSMHDESVYAEKALRAGARGYVMKEKADEVIVDALRTVLRGEVFVSGEMATRMLNRSFKGEKEKTPEYGIEALTERETEVFQGIGQGLSTRKIADKLGLSDRTVEVHRAHIKRKLQCEDAAQLFREAVRWVEQQREQ
jgi:DNA-binding NarL/FixJ family response regulator